MGVVILSIFILRLHKYLRVKEFMVFFMWRVDGCEQEEIVTEILRHYSEVFTLTISGQANHSLSLIHPRVTELMNSSLLTEFHSDEVCTVLNQMHPHKSPRLDGMSPFFYQKYWHLVGDESLLLFYLFLNLDIYLLI